MTILKDVIASVLRDVLIAQHEADLLSESLKTEYEASPLAALTVPRVSIGEMELTLHFSVPEDCEVEEDVQGLPVIIDTPTLSQLPAEAVQHITLKINPNPQTETDNAE